MYTHRANSLRVLHILNELRPSGAEVMLRTASGFWAAHGVQSEILSTGAVPGSYAPTLEEQGYGIHHIPFSKSPIFPWRVYWFLRRQRYDAIHIHTERGGFWYALLSCLSGQARIIRTFHNNFEFTGLLGLERRVQRRVMRQWLGVRMVAIGSSVRQTEESVLGNPCRVISNWFDASRYRPASEQERQAARRTLDIPDGAIAIATVGNCARQKNHGALIEAIAQFAGTEQIVYLHAGQEQNGPGERELAANWGVTNRIRFLGAGLSVATILQASDIFVMPSLYEGFSIAALEGLAAGLPAIMTDVPGLRDLREFCDGIRWAAPTADSLLAALQELCALSREQRCRLGRELSGAIHARFGLENGAARYLHLYRGPGADQDGLHMNYSIERTGIL